jgi:ATPase family associated with various cellular activities (AAA)
MRPAPIAAPITTGPSPAAAPIPTIDLNLVTSGELHTHLLHVNLRAAAIAQAMASGRASFKVFKQLRLSVQADAYQLLDRLAHIDLGEGHRTNSDTVLLLDDGLFVTIEARPKSTFCTCYIRIWSACERNADVVESLIVAAVGEQRMEEPLMIALDWRFTNARGEIVGANIEEVAAESLLDEAYPGLWGGVAAFVTRFLEAPESILLLRGPPGTGKTRLIRGMLGEMSRRLGSPASILYTTDEKVLESDEMFIEFLTGNHQALVVEDADLLLRSRSSGNGLMHRFLNVADGIIRAQNRKMIFSTNLPNMRDIDEALVRPGRCFGHVALRDLTAAEARSLLARLCQDDSDWLGRAVGLLPPTKSTSIAMAFSALRESAPRTVSSNGT